MIWKKIKRGMLAGLFPMIMITASGQGAYLPPDKPKLVVGIIVEQLRMHPSSIYLLNLPRVMQQYPQVQSLLFTELHLTTGTFPLRMNLSIAPRTCL
jgi:hypothetical protein